MGVSLSPIVAALVIESIVVLSIVAILTLWPWSSIVISSCSSFVEFHCKINNILLFYFHVHVWFYHSAKFIIHSILELVVKLSIGEFWNSHL